MANLKRALLNLLLAVRERVNIPVPPIGIAYLFEDYANKHLTIRHATGTYRDLEAISVLPVWDDLRVPLEMARPSTSPPDYAAFRGNLFAHLFSGTSIERVYFACQMPHAWKFGTTVRPHVHIGFPAATVNGQTVRFILDYSVQSPMGGVFAAETSIQADYTINTANAYDAQYGHTTLDLPPIVMTGHTASAMFLCRLSRDGSADTYNQDVAAFEFDFHYEIDSLGTTSEYTGKA